MMMQVDCDVTSLLPSDTLGVFWEDQQALALGEVPYAKVSCQRASASSNNGTSTLPPLTSYTYNLHTQHSFYDEVLLGCKLYSTFPRAQNHADNSLLPSF